MKSDTEKYLHEARTHGAQLPDALTRNGSLTVGQVESLTKHVYEYAIKAPIAENPTGVSKKYQFHSLLSVPVTAFGPSYQRISRVQLRKWIGFILRIQAAFNTLRSCPPYQQCNGRIG